MRRYWLQKKDIVHDQVFFEGEIFHHIFEVCRQQVGSKFEVLTDGGEAFFIEVKALEKKRAIGFVLETRTLQKLPRPYIHLAISLPRFFVMDHVIEKAVELGVHAIHPFFSDYSFIRSQEKISVNKINRWNKIVVSATQQSGRGDLMSISPIEDLSSVLSLFQSSPHTCGILAYEGDSAMTLSTFLNQGPPIFPKTLSDIWIFVGSEGGFSQNDLNLFESSGLKTVTMGSQILRVETACVTLISILKYHFNLM